MSLLGFGARLARVRLADWVFCALLLLAAVWQMAPQQLPVAVYKLALMALAALAAYWLDRSMFPYARPDVLLLGAQAAQQPETRFAALRDVVSFTEPKAAAYEAAGAPLDAAGARELLLLGAVCMVRRSLVVGAGMLAVGLGA